MLYEVITHFDLCNIKDQLAIPAHHTTKFGIFTIFCYIPGCRFVGFDRYLIPDKNAVDKQIPVFSHSVITSYSIHYTKLYEEFSQILDEGWNLDKVRRAMESLGNQISKQPSYNFV